MIDLAFVRGMLVFLPHIVVAGTIFAICVYFMFYHGRKNGR